MAKDVDESSNGSPVNSKRKRAVKQESDSEAEEKREIKGRGTKRKSDAAVKEEDNEEDDKANVGRRRSTRSRK